MVIKVGNYYTVSPDLSGAPLSSHLEHGFETKWGFYKALYRLSQRWKHRTGECVEERHGFLLLRFHDTPGGRSDEEWLPHYILRPAEPPSKHREPSETEKLLNRIFGFE